MFKNVLQICSIVGVLNVQLIRCDSQYSALNLAVDVLQEKVSVNSLKTIVQGFDFNDKEMQNLKLWERGVVPYYIDAVSYDKVLRDRIRTFLDVTNKLSGLHFLELPSPPLEPTARWVFFVNRRGQLGCMDHSLQNFTTTGVQKVLLGYDCITNKRELAEIVLLLAGIPPQHNSPDRDDYINVNFDKIIPGKQYLFEKVKDSEWLFQDLDYDFPSAGHYSFHKHTIDGTATIKPKVDVSVGEGDGFSFTDILKIRMLYNYIRHPKLDELGPSCKKLFKPGANLKKYYPRVNGMQDDDLPRRKPTKYRLANKDFLDDEISYADDGKNQDNNDDDIVDNRNENELSQQSNSEKNDDQNNPVEFTGNENSGDEKPPKNKSGNDTVVQKKYSGDDNNSDETAVNKKASNGKKDNKAQLSYDPLKVLSDYDTDNDKKGQKKENLNIRTKIRK